VLNGKRTGRAGKQGKGSKSRSALTLTLVRGFHLGIGEESACTSLSKPKKRIRERGEGAQSERKHPLPGERNMEMLVTGEWNFRSSKEIGPAPESLQGKK